jgi:hypothetical protein
MKILGVLSQMRSGTINGIEAWMSNHQRKLSFAYLDRHIPRNKFRNKATNDTMRIFIFIEKIFN